MKLVDFLAQVERDCVCNAEGVWLDIVVAIDTSTYNSGYISTAKQILINIARQLPVSLGLGQYTRFSLITYNAFNSTANIIGDLHAYDDAEEFVAAVNTVAATSYTADLYTPFLAASSVFNGTHTRPNVKKLFILIPAIYRVTVDIAPLANQLKGNDTTIMIVDFWYQTAATQGSAQYLALASPGLFFNRTTPNLQDRIVEALCQVNCNCLGDWQQFVVGTKKYGECVRYVNISSTWATARVACQNLVPGAYLVHEYSQAKRTFNIGVAQNTPFYNGLNAWHIGLRWNGTRYNWEGAGNVSIPLTEPVQWARGFPNTVYGSNVWNYHDGWENVSEEPAAYLCQSAALCDSENYCSTL